MAIEEQYDALRAEIVAWQQRRVVVVLSAGALTGTLLGFATSPDDDFLWTLLAAPLLVILAASMLFAVYAADAASRIGAFLEVNYADATWEIDNRRVRSRGAGDLNRWLMVIYVALAGASIGVPASSRPVGQPWHSWLAFGSAAAAFGYGVYRMARSYRKRPDYVAQFARLAGARRVQPVERPRTKVPRKAGSRDRPRQTAWPCGLRCPRPSTDCGCGSRRDD